MRNAYKYRISPEIIYQNINNQFIVINPVTEEFMILNDSGKIICKEIKIYKKIDDLVEKLYSVYKIDKNRLKKDIKKYLVICLKKGVIQKAQ
jgi:predicted peptidase